MEQILVIKLGALGDFVQALGPMKAIRDHHPTAHITLLTTKPYATFANASGLVDSVWLDQRPKFWQIGKVLQLRRTLRSVAFDRVYDLQTSDRSSGYYRLFSPQPQWSGIATGCSHPHANPNRDSLHTIERQAEQLAMAGIESTPAPDVSWAQADISRFNVASPFVLFVPGGAAHRPDKRWPAENYGALAQQLRAQGITPVLLGTQAEHAQISAITAICADAVDLSGQTDFIDIATLARAALAAVGNDTGPMHLIAAAGCKSVVLYAHASDPLLCAQRGPDVTILRQADIKDIAVKAVQEALA